MRRYRVRPVRLRPRARQDRRDEVRYYRSEAGPKIDVARLAGQRQDALRIDPDEAPTGTAA